MVGEEKSENAYCKSTCTWKPLSFPIRHFQPGQLNFTEVQEEKSVFTAYLLTLTAVVIPKATSEKKNIQLGYSFLQKKKKLPNMPEVFTNFSFFAKISLKALKIFLNQRIKQPGNYTYIYRFHLGTHFLVTSHYLLHFFFLNKCVPSRQNETFCGVGRIEIYAII